MRCCVDDYEEEDSLDLVRCPLDSSARVRTAVP
jgi:hypothetical protein